MSPFSEISTAKQCLDYSVSVMQGVMRHASTTSTENIPNTRSSASAERGLVRGNWMRIPLPRSMTCLVHFPILQSLPRSTYRVHLPILPVYADPRRVNQCLLGTKNIRAHSVFLARKQLQGDHVSTVEWETRQTSRTRLRSKIDFGSWAFICMMNRQSMLGARRGSILA